MYLKVYRTAIEFPQLKKKTEHEIDTIILAAYNICNLNPEYQRSCQNFASK